MTKKPKLPKDFLGKLDIDMQQLPEQLKKQREDLMILSGELKEQKFYPFALEQDLESAM